MNGGVAIAQRVNTLETVLEHFIERNEQGLADMRSDIAGLMAKMDADTERMKASMAECEAKMEADTERMKASMAKSDARMEAGFVDLRMHIARNADKMGTLVEDIVSPSVFQAAVEEFHGGEPVWRGIRHRRRHPTQRGREREFDCLWIGETVAIWSETRSNAQPEYAAAFVAALPEFAEYFPEHAHLRLVPIFASLHVPEDVVRYLTRHGVYAMAMGGGIMKLVNFDEVNRARQAQAQ